MWDSGADFRAIVRILPMAKKTPKKGPPGPPQKGPPDPPKRTPQRVPQKTPKAKGEGCGGVGFGWIWGSYGSIYILRGLRGGGGRACGGVGEGPPGTPKPPKP